MWNILSKVFIVVIIVLLFPTGLILASQNASPGDNTYPIKRGMEGVFSSILSLNPITKAYFKTDLSNRRFKESIVLLKRNNTDKTATNTSLVEMLSNTAQASADIKNVSDPGIKKQLTDNLSKQIANYRQGLSVVAKEKNQIPANQITPTPLIPTATIKPGQPTPTRIPGQPSPTPTLIQVSVTPTPSPTPPVPACNDAIRKYSQCGGTHGYEKYSNTHLIFISEYKNSCTGAIKNIITKDQDLTIICDSAIVGQCSDDNIQACIDMLIKIDQPAPTSDIKDGENTQGNTIQGRNLTPTSTPTPTLIPTSTPTPTSTPINTKTKNAYETLLERSQATPSSSVSATPTIASSSGAVQGISISVRNLGLQNLLDSIRSLISIFK